MQIANSPTPLEPAGDTPAGSSTSDEQRKIPNSTPDAGQEPIVRIERVSKQFRGVAALRGVSLNIERGEIFGLIGPNGAGKSTLLKALMGFLRSDSGSIKLFGSTDLTKAHARIGYLPEQPRYHGNFSGREYLEFQARLAGLRHGDARTVTAGALKRVGLEEAANRRIRTYSKGMRQRLGLAVAVYATGDVPPELLVLDEPASGLAPDGQVAVREVLLDCNRQGSTILLCSHQLTEVERTCSRIGILRGGRLVALTRLDDRSRVVIVASARPRGRELASPLIEYLRNLHPAVIVTGGQQEGEPLVVSLPTGDDVPHAAAMKAAGIRAIVDARWDIVSLHVENRDLESIYLQAVGPRKEGAAGTQPNGKEAEAVAATEASPARSAPPLEAAPAQPGGEATAGATTAADSPAAASVEPAAAALAEPRPPEVVTSNQPLLVRPVSSNGSAGSSPGAPGETAPVAARSGPSTAPLPPLPDSIQAQTGSSSPDPWLRDLRREGEES